MPTVSTKLRTYKRGEYVVIKNDSAIHKGMTHRIYHGKVARVFDVRCTSVGVEVAKRSREKQIRKRLYVRAEHILPWAGRNEYLNRAAANRSMAAEAKAAGKTLSKDAFKRQQVCIPSPAQILDINVSDVVEL